MSDESNLSFKPVDEQQRALDLFLKHEGLRIDAYAGTGKTTTLQFLSASALQSELSTSEISPGRRS